MDRRRKFGVRFASDSQRHRGRPSTATATTPATQTSPKTTTASQQELELDKLNRRVRDGANGFFGLLANGDVAGGGHGEAQDGEWRLERRPPDGRLVYVAGVDAHGYAPSELTVAPEIGAGADGGAVRVAGRAGPPRPRMAFERRLRLPNGVDPADVRATLTGGCLRLEAPAVRTSPTSGTSPTPPSPFQASAIHLLLADANGYSAGDLTVTATAGGSGHVRRPAGPSVAVSGRREVLTAGRASARRFRDQFDEVPGDADAGAATAWLRSDGRVLVAMPSRLPGFQYRPVRVLHL